MHGTDNPTSINSNKVSYRRSVNSIISYKPFGVHEGDEGDDRNKKNKKKT